MTLTLEPENNQENISLIVKSVEKTKHISRKSGFRDIHPTLQGFFFTIAGIGLIVAGPLLGSLQVIPTVLVICGVILIVIGFYKMLSHL